MFAKGFDLFEELRIERTEMEEASLDADGNCRLGIERDCRGNDDRPPWRLISVTSEQKSVAALQFALAMVPAFPRITVRTEQMGGVPCIRGLRIPVETVVAMLRGGMTSEEILEDFPDLEVEDLDEAVRFAESCASASGR